MKEYVITLICKMYVAESILLMTPLNHLYLAQEYVDKNNAIQIHPYDKIFPFPSTIIPASTPMIINQILLKINTQTITQKRANSYWYN